MKQNYKLINVGQYDGSVEVYICQLFYDKDDKLTTERRSFRQLNGNLSYQEYLKWVEKGNTPEPADE